MRLIETLEMAWDCPYNSIYGEHVPSLGYKLILRVYMLQLINSSYHMLKTSPLTITITI